MEVATVSDFDRLVGDSLKAIRDDHVREIEARVPAARRQIAGKLRGRRVRFVVGGTALAAAAVAVTMFITQSVPDIDRATPIRPSGTPVVLARIDVPKVGTMETGLGALWVGHPKGLVGIDPATSAIDEKLNVDPVDEIATNSEAIYGVDTLGLGISRIPVGTNEAALGTKALGTPALIAASDDLVWYASYVPQNNSTAVYAVDPKELDYRYENEFPDVVVADMTESQGRVWLSAATQGPSGYDESGYHVIEIPPADSDTENVSVTPLSGTEGSAADIAVGEGAVWVLRQGTQGGGNTITRIDLATNEVNERAVSFDDTLESIAVGEGYLWATTAPTGMDMPDDAQASLHRIDPDTLEPAGEPLEVAGPGSKLAVGYGYVWVADPNNKQIVQVDPYGQDSPRPTASPDAEESQSPDSSQECLTSIPFEPGHPGQAWTWGVGSAEQIGVPLNEQDGGAVVHFIDEEGRFIDVNASPTESTGQEPGTSIEVLDRQGTLTEENGVRSLVFSYEGCSYQLLGNGLLDSEFRIFIRTLTLRGQANASNDAFALWPETTPEDAYESCLLVGEGAESFRTDGGETALQFARDQLGWTDAELTENASVVDIEQGYKLFTVIRGSLGEPPRVELIAREVAPGCWSVSSVSTTVPPRAATSASVTKAGSRLRVGFDLARRGLEAAATIRIPAEDGSVSMTADQFRSAGQQIEGVFRHLSEGGPSGFLVLIEDKNGQVIGAIGQALPSGDFTAG